MSSLAKFAEPEPENAPLGRDRVLFTLVITLIGTFIYAVGINLFYVPHQFLSGGVTGVALILYYLTGIPVGVTNFIINIPILVLSLKYMGKFYTFITIIGTALVSLFLDCTTFMSGWVVIKDPIVSAIAGGALLGCAMGILYRYNSNTGGTDVIGAIVKKYYNIEIGNVVFIINLVIVLCSLYFFSLEPAVCTLVAMYINARLASRLVLGFNQRKAAFIVSDKPLEIANTLLCNIHHGATLLYGQGAFSGAEKKIVFAIVDLTQVTRLRNLVEAIDPHAFVFILNATDVIGRGFTSSSSVSIPKSVRYTVENGKLHPTRMWEYEMDTEAHPDNEEQSMPKTDEK